MISNVKSWIKLINYDDFEFTFLSIDLLYTLKFYPGLHYTPALSWRRSCVSWAKKNKKDESKKYEPGKYESKKYEPGKYGSRKYEPKKYEYE